MSNARPTKLTSVATTIADLPDPSPQIVALLDAWRQSRKGNVVPFKKDFDPLSVPHLLGKLWLYGLEADEVSFTCKLAGEDINRTWKGSIAGKSAQVIFGDQDFKIIAGIWHDVLDVPLIHYGKAEKLQENSLYAAERIVLPLMAGPEDPATGYILGMSLYAIGDLGQARPERILTNAYHVPCNEID